MSQDSLKKTICGIGFMGFGPHKARDGSNVSRCYTTWHDMIRRCYSRKPAYRPWRDVTVCDEWHNFQNFAEWYNENHPNDGGSYHLDKDIKIPGNRIYSPEACMFVTPENNSKAAQGNGIDTVYAVVTPYGEEIEISNMSQFCKDNNLKSCGMYSMFSGRQKSHRGYRPIEKRSKSK